MTERGTAEQFDALVDFVRRTRGFDFTGYKRPSLERRVAKRMDAVEVGRYDEYQAYLRANQEEFALLFDTILINVTSFFRDPPAWEYLAQEIVPRLAERASEQEPLRVWSAGCASGEEAFTLAIVFAEELGTEGFGERVKIYATDIDDHALADARHAIYSTKAVSSVPDSLREKYFEQINGRYSFRRDLRRAVVFGRHDVISDPPISRVDLLSARNTLMYFNPDTQAKILRQFHFALRENGYLFLGKSEMLLSRSTVFKPVDLKRRVFSKIRDAGLYDRLVTMAQRDRYLETPVATRPSAVDAGFETAPVAQVVLDAGGVLAAANAHARALFGVSSRDFGRPIQDLELSYRPVELRSLIERAADERHPVVVREVEWQRDERDVRYLDINVAPLTAADGRSLGVGVTFNDVTRYRHVQARLEDSRHQLETAYEELQSTSEELETTNEELQSTNEELETTNEELQSTNEELETMNEEMQSTNEELETMNDELRDRTEELNQANAFLESILASFGAGVIVLDPALHVQAWNAQAVELWGVRPDEVLGHHFLNLDIGLPVASLAGPLRAALTDGAAPIELELDAVNRRGRPIKTMVTLTPLLGSKTDTRGVIVLTEERGAGAVRSDTDGS